MDDELTTEIREDDARATAQRLAFAAHAIPALIAYLDTSLRYVWINDTYARWFGRPRHEIQGRYAGDVLGAAAWAAVKPYAERALAGEEGAFDNTVLLNDGRIRDVHASYVPHRDDDGRVCGFVALITDTTETKAVERALRRNERLLKRSQAAAQVGSWEVTFDHNLAEVPGSYYWSPETYRIFGVDPATPVTLALFYSHVHPDERPAMQARRNFHLLSATSFESDYRIVRADGSVRTLHSWLDFNPKADGTIHVVGTCQDITERMRAELDTRRAREQLQLVLDSATAFIARYDRDRRVVWANKSHAARFNKTPDELVGCRLADLIGEAAFRVIDPFCARVLAGESVQVELEMPYAKGPRWVHMAAVPTLDTAGVPDGCVAVLTDVTEGRRLEQERERALTDLREVDRRKDEFLAMLSHEMRNPLASILTAVEVLTSVEAGQEDLAAEYRGTIERQAHHMKRLLDDLLDVSRVSRGKIELQKERVDLKALILQAVDVSRPIIAEKRHELALVLAPQPITLEADPTRLVQVFDNLINNAAKYTDPGGHLSIVSTVENGQAVVRVRDDGVGMTPDLLARAFDLFAQGTLSLDRTRGGLGVGLTLVRALVNMHGGSVAAISDGPGRGSELVVTLPLTAAAQAPPPGPTPRASDAASAPLRVLVVDDNFDAARGLAHLLRRQGHQVALAHNGPAALAAASETPPDLVVLDLGLPGIDGYTVAARLRAAGHVTATLVAVTGYGKPEDLRRSREAGFDHHLVKPINFAQLKSIIVEIGGRPRRVG